MPRSRTRPASSSTWRSTIRAMSSRLSRWKITVSSIRLRNSGLKVVARTSSIRSRIPSSTIVAGDPVGADVRGHDQDRVGEVDRAALAVGEPAVVHDLQQHVEDVRVRLLDLVEQDDRVGPAAHRLGQLAALLVADVAGRRADQAGDRVLLHVLGHVDADDRLLGVEHELGQRPGQLGLADAGRAEEEEAADRPVGVGEPGARAAQRVGDRLDRLVLADRSGRAGAPPCGSASRPRPPSAARPGSRSSGRRPRRCPPRSPPRSASSRPARAARASRASCSRDVRSSSGMSPY